MIFGWHHANHITADNVHATHSMQNANRFIDIKPLFTRFNIGHRGRNGWVQAIKIERDVDRTTRQNVFDLLNNVRQTTFAKLLHRDNVVAIIIAGLEPIECACMTTQTNLHAVPRVNLALIRQIGAPVCS